MADYNVNMKQWNGSSFDNVLPLAFNSNALEGKSYNDIIQYAKQYTDGNKLLLYSGQYTGTGTYGSSNPNSIAFPFAPVLFFMPVKENEITNIIRCANVTTDYKSAELKSGGSTVRGQIKKSASGTTIMWYNTSNASSQSNSSNDIYYYVAIGGADLGGQTEWIITTSGTWTVPRTGRYLLELYGGGGNGKNAQGYVTPGYQGGSSGNSWSSITLTAGTTISVVVGAGGTLTNTLEDRKTTFASYSVDGGIDGTFTVAGIGAGNLGSNGQKITKINRITGGQLVTKTGYTNVGAGGQGSGEVVEGAYSSGSSGGPGAVYLKYLGE